MGIKYECDYCGDKAEHEFNYLFNSINSGRGSVLSMDHLCCECRNQLEMFLCTRKPWIKDN